MKVFYFHQHFSTPTGGVGTRSYHFARRLVECGHEVTVICGSYSTACTGLAGKFRRGQRSGNVDGINVIELEISCSNSDSLLKRSLAFLAFAGRSIRIASCSRYDLIFATSTPLTAALPGIAAKWFRGKPFVFEVRDLWPELPRAMGIIRNRFVLSALAFLERRAYRAADCCIGLAPGIVAAIEAQRGVRRVELIPNGCDLDLFGGETIDGWRPESVPSDSFMAVFAGTHGMANGLDAILDVASELKRIGRMDIKLVLVGDGKRKSHLQQRARLDQLENVDFQPNIPKSQVASLLKGADVGLQVLLDVPAFYYGTSPNKFFDYLAAGLPVLNNYPGWVADMIIENGCGLAVPPGDPAAFARKLVWMADNQSATKQMGRSARNLAERAFSRSELADRFVMVLENTYTS